MHSLGYRRVVKRLIENGAIVNVTDDSGVSPLHHAAFGGLYADLCRQLSEYTIECHGHLRLFLIHALYLGVECFRVELLQTFGTLTLVYSLF